MNKKLLCFIFLSSLLTLPANSQEFAKLIRMPASTAKVDTLLNLLSKSKDSAELRQIFTHAHDAAQSISYTDGVILAYDKYGVALRNLSRYTEALFCHKKALELVENSKDPILKIQILNNIGVVYRRIDENKLAIDYHMQALQLADKQNDLKNICISTNSLGNIHFSLEQYKEAMECFRRALPLEAKRGNLLGMSINYNNIGLIYSIKGNYDSALFYVQKSLEYDLKINHKSGEAICYNDLGDIYLKKNEYSKAQWYYNKALKIHKKIGDEIYVSVSYTNIANAYLCQKDYASSIKYYQSGLDIALKIGSKWQAETVYYGLSKCYKEKGQFDKALMYYEKATAYSDSIRNEKNVSHITRIQAIYNTEKKQQQIELLKKEKQTSNLIALIVSIIAITIIIIFIFTYRTIVQKRKIIHQELKLREQKIRQLEKDRQLIASHAALQGEEAERSRLARDLHDGLGGLLSGVKLALSGVKGNYIVSQESVKQFDRALGLLDNSIYELRRVAHNMMPEALVKYGLKEAMEDFCAQLYNHTTSVRFQFFGEEDRIDQSMEIAIYRIAQELVNNALKHAQASTILVQLIKEDKRLHLTVQDDGKGFDTSALQTSKGAGILNIRSRTEALNGRFDLFSKPGAGTEVCLEFTLKS